MPALKRRIFAPLLLPACALLLTSCSEQGSVINKSPDGHFAVYEQRINGAGPAPDTVKAYILVSRSQPSSDDVPFFEGQDVGRICYNWSASGALQVKISGGYVDRVAQVWPSPDGRRLIIRYRGMTGCTW